MSDRSTGIHTDHQTILDSDTFSMMIELFVALIGAIITTVGFVCCTAAADLDVVVVVAGVDSAAIVEDACVLVEGLQQFKVSPATSGAHPVSGNEPSTKRHCIPFPKCGT